MKRVETLRLSSAGENNNKDSTKSSPPLLSKLAIPKARQKQVRRERLLNILNQGYENGRRLSLISAPAGYGKSVLAAEWVRNLQARGDRTTKVFWLSLEERDNSPGRFFSYLASIYNNYHLDTEWFDDDPDGDNLPAVIEQVLTGLINYFESESATAGIGCESSSGFRPAVLVFDDYHRIHRPLIHKSMQFLLDHCPESLHLFLVTREDPPLSLSRLRGQDDLTELRARELVFTEEETARFMQETMDLDLSREWVGDLARQTEGWVAGLQLAALSLRQQKDIETFIRQFKGTHRYLVDYLVDEVLRSQPEERRLFLCRTSILKYFNAELCAAVSGFFNSNKLLAEIEKANLFLISLDDKGLWYRYHHLFADCLSRELETEERKMLYKIAAKWSEEMGYFADAVEYVLLAADPDLSANTIERIIKNSRAWSGGFLSMFESWLNALPGDSVNSRPALQIAASWVFFLVGKIEKSELLLDLAKLTMQDKVVEENKENASLLAQIEIYRAACLAMKGNLIEAGKILRAALDHTPADNLHIKARAMVSMGLIHELSGNTEEALNAYHVTADYADTVGVTYLAVHSRCEVAMILLTQGRLSEAETKCREALELAGKADETIPPVGLAKAILGEIKRERGNLCEAEQLINDGIKLSQVGGIIYDLRYDYYFLTRLHLSSENHEALTDALSKTTQILLSYRIPRLTNFAAAMKAWVALKTGDMRTAPLWAEEYERRKRLEPVEYLREGEDLILARVLLAKRNYQEAGQLLEQTAASARMGARSSVLIETLILKSRAAWNQGGINAAKVDLREALALGNPEGYMRVFVDEGAEMKTILAEYLAVEKDPSLIIYGRRIVAEFDRTTNSPPIPGVLSAQEIRILNLLAEGCSNQEIANKLFISLGTAKWHAHNIYEKLDVNNRTQAISKGRELKII